MRKLIIYQASTANYKLTPLIFRLRQGLGPAITGESTPDYLATGVASPNYAVSPDGEKAIATNGSSGTNNFRYSTVPPNEGSILPSSDVPAAHFNGTVQCVATSDTHFAVGGSNPFLYVFDWESKTLQPVSTTGLGALWKIAFNEEGTKMAVIHQSSPYLRIYDTEDWSFVNASPAAAYPSGASYTTPMHFTSDGRLIIGGQSPYINVYDVDSGLRLHSITSSTFVNSVTSFIQHPDNPDALIWSGNNTSVSDVNKRLGVLNMDDYSMSNPFVNPPTAVFDMALDKVNRELILIHNNLNGRYCSVVRLDDPLVYREPSDELNAQIRNIGVRLVVLDKDTGVIRGTVRDIDNNPAARQVMAINREGSYTSASTMSDPSTGDYELIVENTTLHDVQFRIEDGEMLNDLFFARVEPEAM